MVYGCGIKMLSCRVSKLFFSENKDINFQGDENLSHISHTNNSNFNADRSELNIQNCQFIEASVTESVLNTTHSKRMRFSGHVNLLNGNNNEDILINGNDNKFTIQNTSDFLWSGSRGECGLDDEQKPKIYGNDNQIIAKENCNFFVVGNKNKILAHQNSNLKVRGCSNNVAACLTRNLTVDGINGQCSVFRTSVGHSLIRNPDKQSIENVIQFQSKMVPHLVCEGTKQSSIEGSQFANYYWSKRISNLVLTSNNQFEEQVRFKNMEKRVESEVKILYTDKVRIVNKQYRVGRFDFCVEGLNIWEGNSSIRLKILWTPDGMHYKVETSPQGESATAVFYSENVDFQKLKIVGKQVLINSENPMEFDILFEPTEAET